MVAREGILKTMFALKIQGKKPGKTLLVTGGMDGDEYAGIEAAYTLAEQYKEGNFAGRLVIVPVVNMPGFQNESSHNPKDGKFPKFIFPGRRFGTSSERMVHRLLASYVRGADAWLDLHGGALTERMTPFLWMFDTGVVAVDSLGETFYRASGAAHVLVEKCGAGSKAYTLARQGCLYILAESGGRGERKAEDVERHMVWAGALMQTLGMLEETLSSHQPPAVYRHVELITAPFDGIVRSTPRATVTKGDTLAEICTYDTGNHATLTSPVSGTILWQKETMSMRRGDTLYAIGY